MWQILGSMVDVVHAFFMAAWLLGLPLLYWRRWPRLTRAYGFYAVVFILVSQGSHLFLGECFLTTIAGRLWEHSFVPAALPINSREWFTVRLATWVFDMAPSHRAIVVSSELLILLTALGELLSLRRSPAMQRWIANVSPRLRPLGLVRVSVNAPRGCEHDERDAREEPEHGSSSLGGRTAGVQLG